jgi:hypothetical protein
MSGPMKDGGFEIDFSSFDKRFFEYALKTAPAAAEKGMFEALAALKNDADNVTPQTPFLDGNLRGDYTMILEGITQSKLVENSGGKGKDHKKGGAKPAERYGAKDIIAKLIFRMPYAAKWHEAVNKKVNWTKTRVSSPGPKYLETKLMAFGKKYFGLVAQRVRETTGK